MFYHTFNSELIDESLTNIKTEPIDNNIFNLTKYLNNEIYRNYTFLLLYISLSKNVLGSDSGLVKIPYLTPDKIEFASTEKELKLL